MQYDSTLEFPGPSKLSKYYGKEIVNYYAGSPLNRLSFLRSNPEFLRAALPHGYFILLNNLNALSISSISSNTSHLAFVPYKDISELLSEVDFDDDRIIAEYDSSPGKRRLPPVVLFLGVDEGFEFERELQLGESEKEREREGERFTFEGGYRGRPYFAVDVTEAVKEGRGLEKVLLPEGQDVDAPSSSPSIKREWLKPGLQLGIVPKEAAILPQARSLLDWNARNQFCAACGSKTISVQAGTKRICPPKDKALVESNGDRPPCISRSGIHNIAFPRTDASVIMAILNHKHDKILLGRQSRWPPSFYSTLAGFLEPGESIEEAVRRETWEESGVRVGRVVIHSSQPWPYPANIMVGCIGEALAPGEEVEEGKENEAEKIHLGHDPELQDAKWFGIDEVRKALGEAVMPGQEKSEHGFKESELRVPAATAIAHQLMLAAVKLADEAAAVVAAAKGVEAKI